MGGLLTWLMGNLKHGSQLGKTRQHAFPSLILVDKVDDILGQNLINIRDYDSLGRINSLHPGTGDLLGVVPLQHQAQDEGGLVLGVAQTHLRHLGEVNTIAKISPISNLAQIKIIPQDRFNILLWSPVEDELRLVIQPSSLHHLLLLIEHLIHHITSILLIS